MKNKKLKLSILILSLILILFLDVHFTYDRTPNTTKFVKANFTDHKKLMIVAHPDDETIWGMNHLVKGDYFVVCLTNSDNFTRKRDFYSTMNKLNTSGIILNYPDKNWRKRVNWELDGYYKAIHDDIDFLISKHNWEKIVTHNPYGEYGHIQHQIASRIVTEVALKRNVTNKLEYFGLYYKKKNLILKGQHKHLSKNEIIEKENIFSTYTTEKKVGRTLKHMFPFENWITYDEFKSLYGKDFQWIISK